MLEETLDYVPVDMYDAPSFADPIPTSMPQRQQQQQVPMLPPSQSLGASSPGEHKYLAIPGDDIMPGALAHQDLIANPYVQYPEYYPNRPMAEYPVSGLGQELTEEQKQAKMAVGVSVVAVGAGAAVGYTYGGIYGAFAGALFGGTVVNAYRAYANAVKGTETGDKEAKISGTYAVLTGALGGFLWYKLVEKDKSKMTANPEPEVDDDGPDEPDEPEGTSVIPTQGACAIRKAV